MPIFVAVTIVAALLAVPIVFALLMGPLLGFALQGNANMLPIALQRMFAGINQFPLLAVPLFILAGEIMNAGGITRRLVAFSRILVGRLRGGLAHINVLSSMLFAGLSGSAVADTSALGSMLVPAMERDGYTRAFATAVTAASSIIGPIVPPSIIMIVYAYIMNVSVGALFAAGIVPGLLMGLSLMAMVAWLARRHGFPRDAARPTGREAASATLGAVFPLLTPVIILGGIVGGVFSPTEAAAVAVVYALALSFALRTLKPIDLPDILRRSATSAAIILLVIGSASLFGWALNIAGVPQAVAGAVLGVSDNPLLFLLLVNVLLLLIGMVLDAGPAILILGPILGPTLAGFDVSPVHFAIVMCVNLTVGLATPPFGLVLFTAATISDLKVEAIVRAMLPFYAVHAAVILLITYVPAISLTLPRLLGFPV